MEHSKEEIYQKQHIDVDTKPPIVGGARRVRPQASLQGVTSPMMP
jgi:hypothetical protein